MLLRDMLNFLCDTLEITRSSAMDIIRSAQREGYTYAFD